MVGGLCWAWPRALFPTYEMVRLAPRADGMEAANAPKKAKAPEAKAKVEAKAAEPPKAEPKETGGVVVGQSPDGFDWGETF